MKKATLVVALGTIALGVGALTYASVDLFSNGNMVNAWYVSTSEPTYNESDFLPSIRSMTGKVKLDVNVSVRSSAIDGNVALTRKVLNYGNDCLYEDDYTKSAYATISKGINEDNVSEEPTSSHCYYPNDKGQVSEDFFTASNTVTQVTYSAQDASGTVSPLVYKDFAANPLSLFLGEDAMSDATFGSLFAISAKKGDGYSYIINLKNDGTAQTNEGLLACLTSLYSEDSYTCAASTFSIYTDPTAGVSRLSANAEYATSSGRMANVYFDIGVAFVEAPNKKVIETFANNHSNPGVANYGLNKSIKNIDTQLQSAKNFTQKVHIDNAGATAWYGKADADYANYVDLDRGLIISTYAYRNTYSYFYMQDTGAETYTCYRYTIKSKRITKQSSIANIPLSQLLPEVGNISVDYLTYDGSAKFHATPSEDSRFQNEFFASSFLGDIFGNIDGARLTNGFTSNYSSGYNVNKYIVNGTYSYGKMLEDGAVSFGCSLSSYQFGETSLYTSFSDIGTTDLATLATTDTVLAGIIAASGK
jgi:hypothetical protein